MPEDSPQPDSKLKSDMHHIFHFLKTVFMYPWTLICVLIGKKHAKHLLKPIHHVWVYLTEAKATAALIAYLILFYVAVPIVALATGNPDAIYDATASNPSDLLELNFLSIILSTMMHASPMHLIGNLIALLIFGRILEHKLGPWKVVYIYALSAVLSIVIRHIIYLLMGNNTAVVGASGAISGLVSVAMLISPFRITSVLLGIPLPAMVLGWLFLFKEITSLMNSVPGDNVDHFAHLAGFFSITLIWLILPNNDKKELRNGLFINIITFVIVFTLFIYIGPQYGFNLSNLLNI